MKQIKELLISSEQQELPMSNKFIESNPASISILKIGSKNNNKK